MSFHQDSLERIFVRAVGMKAIALSAMNRCITLLLDMRLFSFDRIADALSFLNNALLKGYFARFHSIFVDVDSLFGQGNANGFSLADRSGIGSGISCHRATFEKYLFMRNGNIDSLLLRNDFLVKANLSGLYGLFGDIEAFRA